MKQGLRYDDYFDKVYGGWFGKCLGGASGALVEGVKGRIEVSFRELMDPSLPNDDLDIQLLWLEQLEKKGPWVTGDDLASAWLNQCWYPFGEYGYFLRNYMRGIRPPTSGWFNNSFFKGGMGSPIRSEIWAMVSPGDPERAARLAWVDTSLDHDGDSNWAEVFLAALESRAFHSSDLPAMIEEALKYVTEDCRFLRCAKGVIDAHRAGASFDAAVQGVRFGYSHPDFTNSVQNMGYILCALLYGSLDMERTIDLALSCGYDADCTCATAAAVVGIVTGYRSIPAELRSLMKDNFVCGIDVKRRDDSIHSLAEDTCIVGVSLDALRSGGRHIEEIPPFVALLQWEKPEPNPTLSLAYDAMPSIGRNDRCGVTATLQNPSLSVIEGTFAVMELPEGWTAEPSSTFVCLAAGGAQDYPVLLRTGSGTRTLEQTNLLRAVVTDASGLEVASTSFGVVGATVWRVLAPFTEPMGAVPIPGQPSAHGAECPLPPLEAMFSNQADPQKEYLDESAFAAHPERFPAVAVINAYEDLVPVDGTFGLQGECTYYLSTRIDFPEDREVWLVIGNNDAFRIWVNGVLVGAFDEVRFWQPHAHGIIVPFRAGVNSIVLKLSRRTEKLQFSIGFRRYEGNHFHRMKWHTDYACLLSDSLQEQDASRPSGRECTK